MLSVNSLAKSFNGNNVIDGVSFELADSELIGLVGPSNGGKSVLIKLLGGILEADSGQAAFNDEQDKSRIGFSFQEEALFDSMSVIENVAFPLLVHRTFPHDQAMEKAHQMLSEVGLAQAMNKVPGQLSGGMRRRVAIARALVNRPKLAFLDDPTSGLDPVAANVIMNLILKLHKELQSCFVIVSHDIRRLLPHVERVLALFEGQILYDGCPKALVKDAPQNVLNFLSTRFDFSVWQEAQI